MNKKNVKKWAVFLLGVALSFSAVAAHAATVPIISDFYADSLQAGISASATSFTLVRGTSQNVALSGPYGFTLDQGTASQENVFCSSVTGVAATGCVRGLDLTTGTTSVASLEQVHNRGASVQITTAPIINILTNIMRGLETIPQTIFYDPSVSTSTLANGNPQAIASVAYSNYVGTAGCANATNVARGCVQLATNVQAASSTALGTTGANLDIPAANASSSPNQINDTGLHVVVSQNDDKINPNYIATSSAYTYNWQTQSYFSSTTFAGATTTLTATTSIAASQSNKLVLNGVPYVAPATQGVNGTILANNGSGGLSWTGSTPRYTLSQTAFSVTNGYATSSILSVPAGILSASSTITLQINGACAHGGFTGTCSVGISTSAGTIMSQCGDSINSTSITYAQQLLQTTIGSQSANVQQTLGNLISIAAAPGSAASAVITNCDPNSTVNLAAGVSLVVVENGSAENVTPTYSFILTVNP